MKRFVRGLRDWTFAAAIAVMGSFALSAADRPPASDQPWPVEEREQPVDTPSARQRAPQTVRPTPGKARPAGAVATVKVPSRGEYPAQAIGSGVRAASHRRQSGVARSANGYVPIHDRQVRGVQYGPSSDEVFENDQGELVFEDGELVGPLEVPPTESEMFLDDDCEFCGEGFGFQSDCCLIPCPPWGSLQAFFGTQGFTGPVNVGATGSFGFHEGINYGSRLPWGIFPALGWQVGARFTQSDLSGSELTDTRRGQTFLTTGLFRRVDHGLQMGVAFDLLQEQWYGDADLTQIRAELGWVYNTTTEFGFWCAVGGRERAPVPTVPLTPAVSQALDTVWAPTDMYLGYVKRYLGPCEHGYARAFVGGTGLHDGIIGADALLPMTDQWSIQAGFTYLIPEQSVGAGSNAGHAQESWNLGVSLVWTPGRAHFKNNYRPFFTVADNGSFLVDRR